MVALEGLKKYNVTIIIKHQTSYMVMPAANSYTTMYISG